MSGSGRRSENTYVFDPPALRICDHGDRHKRDNGLEGGQGRFVILLWKQWCRGYGSGDERHVVVAFAISAWSWSLWSDGSTGGCGCASTEVVMEVAEFIVVLVRSGGKVDVAPAFEKNTQA
jgi:hypothetical protein